MERLHDNFLFSGKRIEKRNPENIDFYFSPGRPGDVRFFYATIYYSEAMYIYYYYEKRIRNKSYSTLFPHLKEVIYD